MRRWRNLKLRRGQYFAPIPAAAATSGPQVLPPAAIDQAGTRPRRLYIRRGRYFQYFTPQVAPGPQALPPAAIDQAGTRPRPLYIRPGRFFQYLVPPLPP